MVVGTTRFNTLRSESGPLLARTMRAAPALAFGFSAQPAPEPLWLRPVCLLLNPQRVLLSIGLLRAVMARFRFLLLSIAAWAPLQQVARADEVQATDAPAAEDQQQADKHAEEPLWEWSGVFELEAGGAYTWSAARGEDGAYADAGMRLVVVALPAGAEAVAEAEGLCEVAAPVTSGDTLALSGGTCYRLSLGKRQGGGAAPGKALGGRPGVARERREVGSAGRSEYRSEMGARGAELDRTWHSIGVVPALQRFRAGIAPVVCECQCVSPVSDSTSAVSMQCQRSTTAVPLHHQCSSSTAPWQYQCSTSVVPSAALGAVLMY